MGEDLIVSVEGVTKKFESPHGLAVLTLDAVSFAVPRGSLTCILGPSGCGKTTLLRMIAGLEQPDEGVIRVGGQPVTGPDAGRGMLFQDYALFPWRTVEKNVEFGLEVRGVSRQKRREIARRFINLVGLDGFESYYPHQLSGGMRQRVAVARVMANDPRVILMDEPFGSLDAQTRAAMQSHLKDLHRVTGKTIVLVTHSVDEALVLGHEVIVLSRRPGAIKDVIRIRPGSGPVSGSHYTGLRSHILDLIDHDGIGGSRPGQQPALAR